MVPAGPSLRAATHTFRRDEAEQAEQKAGVPGSVPTVKGATIDLDAVPTVHGQSVYELDPETLENKPWLKPGADLTDYFNYGFDETIWKRYCAKQVQLREGTRAETNRPPVRVRCTSWSILASTYLE